GCAFFFQAEDGIRDGHVTGVQTSALPILNRIASSRRLEREAQRNVELMWLTRRLAPDFKTIADLRRDNGAAIRKVCAQFVVLCRSEERRVGKECRVQWGAAE